MDFVSATYPSCQIHERPRCSSTLLSRVLRHAEIAFRKDAVARGVSRTTSHAGGEKSKATTTAFIPFDDALDDLIFQEL